MQFVVACDKNMQEKDHSPCNFYEDNFVEKIAVIVINQNHLQLPKIKVTIYSTEII